MTFAPTEYNLPSQGQSVCSEPRSYKSPELARFKYVNFLPLASCFLTSPALSVLICKMGKIIPTFWGMKGDNAGKTSSTMPSPGPELHAISAREPLNPRRHLRTCGRPWRGHACVRNTNKREPGVSQDPRGCPEAV